MIWVILFLYNSSIFKWLKISSLEQEHFIDSCNCYLTLSNLNLLLVPFGHIRRPSHSGINQMRSKRNEGSSSRKQEYFNIQKDEIGAEIIS